MKLRGVAVPILAHNGEACQLKQYRHSRETISKLHEWLLARSGMSGAEKARVLTSRDI